MNSVKPIPIFISSPGDVADERKCALSVIDRLNAEADYRGQVLIPVAWDLKGGGTAMEATETPQHTINQWMRKPSACAIVIVILWSRLGSPLPKDKFSKPDGSPYLSGTEWEYDDAVRGQQQSSHDPQLPRVLVYHRTEEPVVKLNDPQFDEKRQQYQRVQEFLKQFKGKDGSFIGGVNDYATPADFERDLEKHLRQWRSNLVQANYDPLLLDPQTIREQEALTRQQVTNEAARKQNRPDIRNYGKVINSLPQVDMVDRFRDRASYQSDIVNALVEGYPLVSVYGQGGIGKTALACKVLGDLQRDQSGKWDGLIYLGAGSQGSTGISLERIVLDGLKPLSDSAREQVEAVWRNLGANTHQKAMALIDQYIASGGRYVLLLDNLETLQDPSTHKLTDQGVCAFFEALAERGAGLRVLVTSREQLDLSDLKRALREKRVPLVDGLPVDDAIQLLIDLDSDGEAGIKDKATDPVVLGKLKQIVQKIDGLPRALETAINLLRLPRMTLDRLLNEPALLSGKVEQLVEEAIRRLDPDSLRVMEALAVYGRPLSQTGLEYLLASYLDIQILPGLLDRLVSGYFISFNKATALYALHPIDRDFCLNRVPLGSQTDVPDPGSIVPLPYTRHVLLCRAADYHRQQRREEENWKTITDLEPQLLEFEYRVELGDYNAAADLLTDIDFNYLLLWGHALRVIAMHECLQGHITQARLAGISVGRLGLAYAQTGRAREAIWCFERALDSARRNKSQQAENVWLGNLGNAYSDLGQVAQAIEFYQQALEINRAIGDRRGEGHTLGNLGSVYYNLGQTQQAIEFYRQALEINRAIGDRRGEGHTLGNLGSAYYNLGQTQQAIDFYQQQLVIVREIGDRSVESYALQNLGDAYRILGQPQEAIAHLQQALILAGEINEPRSTQYACSYLAKALLLSDDLIAACDTVMAALTLDVPENNHNTAALYGLIEARSSHQEVARAAFESAVDFANKILSQTPGYYDALYARGLACSGLALVAGASIDPAIEDYRTARATCDAAGVVQYALWDLDQLMLCPGGERLAVVRDALAGLS